VAKSTLVADYNAVKGHKTDYKKITGACFASLFRENTSHFSKVRYVAEQDSKAISKICPVLEMSEIKNWIVMNRRWKMLPRSARFSYRRWDQQLIIDFSKCPVNLVYLYLTIFRYLREDPGIVRAVTKLVMEQNVNPYIAMVLVHHYCQDFIGHSVLPITRGYITSRAGLTGEETFDLAMARQLRLFVNNPWEYDKRPANKQYGFNAFSLHSMLNTIPVPVGLKPGIKLTKFKYADNKDVITYVMTDNENVERRLAKKLAKECT